MPRLAAVLAVLSTALTTASLFSGEGSSALPRPFRDGRFSWKASGALLAPRADGADPQISVKDPTIVRDEGRWHLFCTVRFASGKVDMAYASFVDWKDAREAPLHVLGLHDKYYCAPQVFREGGKWYLVYQMGKDDSFGPAFSTSATIGDPRSWSKPEWLIPDPPKGRKWLDFWVVADESKAHLFYTSLDGNMWRCETRRSEFPRGWSEPERALQADIFEASHTYRLAGAGKYLTIIEAQGDGRRYYKAYLSDRLEGPWKGLADTREKPFAALSNIRQDPAWTANVSHGEFLRTASGLEMEVDPTALRFLFQGTSDAEYRGNPYGKIPWRLGMLELEPEHR
jgi:hypothetical protein